MAGVLCTLFATIAIAQGPRYAESMQKNIAAMYQENSAEHYQKMANNFERIANAEKNQWHPFYYAGYALVMQAYSESDLSKVDPILDKAEEHLNQAAALSPDNSEVTAVQSMVLSARMRVDMSRSMTMGPKSSAMLQKAMGQQPSGNPRVMMNMAQNIYYTPEAFGGGKKKGIELMQKALAMYESFKPATDLDPNWGKPYVESMLKEWNAN